MKRQLWIAVLASLLLASSVQARNFPLQGNNELCGGIGFAADLTHWAPGGFKWFNDYSRKLSELTWLNFQLNTTAGGTGGYDYYCWYDQKGRQHCDYLRRQSTVGGAA